MSNYEELIHKLNPAVHKKWLLLLAGLMWTGVGSLLCSLAVGWLVENPSPLMLLLGCVGVIISFAVYRFGFVKIAQGNIMRIWNGLERVCLFSFQSWKSYLIIIVMMSGGILLRNSMLPKPYLAVLYLAIGGGLFLSSIHYYTYYFQKALR